VRCVQLPFTPRFLLECIRGACRVRRPTGSHPGAALASLGRFTDAAARSGFLGYGESATVG